MVATTLQSMGNPKLSKQSRAKCNNSQIFGTVEALKTRTLVVQGIVLAVSYKPVNNMASQKPLLTASSIHNRVESCASNCSQFC